MERRAAGVSRRARVCGLVVIGGSLLSSGCTRSPREVFSQVWGPVKASAARVCGRQVEPGCGDAGGGLKTAGIDPEKDPFLTAALASAETAKPQGTTPAATPTDEAPVETLFGEAEPAGTDDGHPTDEPAAVAETETTAEADAFLAFVAAASTDVEDAEALVDEEPADAPPEKTGDTGETDPDDADATRLARESVADLLNAARSHQDQGRLDDARRAARSAETMAALAGLEFGPEEESPAKVLASLDRPAPPLEEEPAESVEPAVPDAGLPDLSELFSEGPAPPAVAEAPEEPVESPPAPELKPAPEPAFVEAAAASAAPAEAEHDEPPHGVRITAARGMIVESRRVPSRFSDLRDQLPRVVARPNNGAAYAGVITTAEQQGRPLVELAVPEEMTRAVRVNANEGTVVELEAPGDRLEVIPDVALQQPNLEALPAFTDQHGAVPEPMDVPAATASAETQASVEIDLVEAPRPQSAEPVTAPAVAREVPNVRWEDAPQIASDTRRWPAWLPYVMSGGFLAIAFAILWRRGR